VLYHSVHSVVTGHSCHCSYLFTCPWLYVKSSILCVVYINRQCSHKTHMQFNCRRQGRDSCHCSSVFDVVHVLVFNPQEHTTAVLKVSHSVYHCMKNVTQLCTACSGSPPNVLHSSSNSINPLDPTLNVTRSPE